MIDHRRRAVTLMELLVVFSILGMLMALLLPAVQASRESARLTSCQNNLKQLGLAALNHESAHGRFPTGGWGFAWVGDPDRGTGRNQPGGWLYCLLPYFERADLARIGAGEPFNKKKDALTLVVQVPIGIFNCPSRRYHALSALAADPPPVNYNVVPEVAQTDYAVNAGDYDVGGGPGPHSLDEGDNPSYQWHDTSKATGIAYLRSEVARAQIIDGSSRTYLVGEKYAMQTAGIDTGDDQSMYSGYDYDTFRWGKAESPPLWDGRASAPDRFGSAHPSGCNFVFCDGSVRRIDYGIDPKVHRRLSNRQDRLTIDDAEF
ncbi:MAG: DUF1559 domain-containing protein [Pirellulales bacterium]